MKVSTPIACGKKIVMTKPAASLLQRSAWLSFSFSLLLMLGSFFSSKAQFSIAATATNYTQDFNGLTSGAWADGTTLTGWYARTDMTASITTYGANTGTNSTGALYAFGVAGTNPLSDRALGLASSNGFTGGSGTGKGYIGWRLKNNTGSAVSSIQVTWTGEQWRKDNTVAQSLVLSYQQGATVSAVTGGTWTAAGSTFSSPIFTTGAAALDGNAPANRTAGITVTITVNIPAGQEIMLRWEDLNDTGNDHLMAIDDVTVKATSAISAPTLTTVTATSITTTSAVSGGNITLDGGAAVTSRGVAYGQSPNPGIAGDITSDGTGTGAFVSNLSTNISPNTKYYYRAYAYNGQLYGFGNESNFFTLANTPGIPTVNGATATSLNVTMDANLNPATTEFAIQETGSSNYVQADGSLDASPVWQTASAWGTKTVTGLSVNTSYDFQVKARNGENVETAFGSSAGLYTLANTPDAPTVNNATSFSLDVSLNLNANPASTEFAIQETGSSNYVQADGSLGASPVWQTASTWGTITVTGLTASTSYTFQVNARNGINTETGFGATQSGTTLAANAPVLTETPLTAAFGSVCINTTAANSFTITGTDLSNAAVTVGPLAGFSFSTDGNTYTASLSISQGGGSFSQEVFVQFAPTAVQSYDGNIEVGGGGAVTDDVAASGSGTNTAPTVTADDATGVTIDAASIAGTITADGCSATTAYGVEYSTSSGFANGSGIQSPGSNLSAGAFSVNLAGLSTGTPYYYHTYATNAGGTSYSAEGTFTTLTPALSIDLPSIGFGNMCINTSAANTITITGTNLSAADVTVGSLDGYSFSTDDITYLPSLDIVQPGGSFSQLIYVKLSPVAVQSYDGLIPINGGGASSLNLAVTGSGTNTAPLVTTGGASDVTQVAATLNGTIDDNGCTAITAYGIEYSTSNGFANGTGTQAPGSNLNLGAFSADISGLNPGITYYYKAYATNDAGTSYGTQQSFAALALDAPEATAGTSIAGDSFTANWNAVTGADSYRLDVSTSPTFGTTTTTTDLIISEYIEGSSNNKYIEIYNGTGASVNLSDYRLRLYTNGGSSTTSDVALSGTLANGSTIVYKNGSAAVYAGAATTNGAVNYNGDDAVALYKISTSSNVDIFGNIGEDPGTAWTSGAFTTLDKTLVRKASVSGGVTVDPASGFPTLATEWDQFNTDDVSHLGSHDFTSVTPSFVPGYNNLTVNGLSQSVTGLTAGTTYYYRVRAFSNTSTSENSNTITVQTVACTATVTATAGANGSITPAGATDYTCGEDVEYTITPSSCYHISEVIVDGQSQGAVDSYTFSDVTSTHSISASFAINTPLASPVVTGPVNVCAYVGSDAEVTYTFSSAGSTGYSYILPPNMTLSASTSNSITVKFLSAFESQANKQLRVTALSDCGNSPQVIFYMVAQGPVTPHPITGNTNVCPVLGTAGTYTYTISSVPAATAYIWIAQAGTTTITHPNGEGVNDTTITVSFSNGFTSSAITVQAANGCGTSSIRSLTVVRANPSAPSPIAGPTNSCPYIGPDGATATYTIASLAGATSYSWTVPAGAIDLTGQGTPSISFKYPSGFVSGQLSVTATNGCGTGAARTLSINKLNPSAPGVIDIIQTSDCPDRVFSYTIAALPSNSTSLQWTVPAGATLVSGQGTNSITVSYPSTSITGNVTAQAFSNCGSSSIRVSSVRLAACPPDDGPPPPAPFAKAGTLVPATAAGLAVNVFPNPSTADFKVQVLTAGKEKISVRIMDMQGRDVKELVVMPYQMVNIGNELKAGSYMLEVRQGGSVKTTKLLKF